MARAELKLSRSWFSPLLLAIALTPAFMQTQYTCKRSGDTRLESLELEVSGVNVLAFDPALRVYDLWLDAGATEATVRAVPMDPDARVTWYVPDGTGTLASGSLGVGGGEVTVELPPDGFALYIGVFPPGGATDTYIMNMSPICPQGDPCFNGGVPGTCSGGVCVTSCAPTAEICDDGIDNDCDRLVDFDDDDCVTVDAGDDQAVDEGFEVQFSGDVRCACDYQWDFGDGTAPETGTLTPTHVYADDGSYQVTLTMTPGGGPTYADTLEVIVLNVAPTLATGLDVSGNQVTVNGTFNDRGTLDTHVASIDWGDGQSGPAPVTESPFGPPGATSGADGSFSDNHIYVTGGTYTVTLTVEDDDLGVVADSLTRCVSGAEICNDGVDNDCDGLVDVADDACSSLIALSVVLSSSVLEIDGPQVPYTAFIDNPVASIATVSINGWIEQGAVSRAGLGTNVRCGVVPDGELPLGSCVFDYVTRASNTGAGTGTLVPGPATARFVLELREGTDPPLVLLEIEMPVTLVAACVPTAPDDALCDYIDNDCDGETDEDVVVPDHPNGSPQQLLEICPCPSPSDGLYCLVTCEDLNCGPPPAFWGCDPDNPAPEICDGIDNDCDGNVDEESDLSPPEPLHACVESACYGGLGWDYASLPDGTDCSHELPGGVCLDASCCQPTTETCDDGIDNDCDGLVDAADEDCTPPVVCPCFTAELLEQNRSRLDTCRRWIQTEPGWTPGPNAPGYYDPGIWLHTAGTYQADVRADHAWNTVPDPDQREIHCMRQGFVQSDGLPNLSGWANPGAGAAKLTQADWEACEAIIEAEVAAQGLTCDVCQVVAGNTYCN